MKNKLEKMYFMEGYLLCFNPNIYKYENEDEVIERFLKNPKKTTDGIKELWQEGQEVLAMDPFPWEWMCDILGYTKYDVEKKISIVDPKIYKLWLEEILSKLAIEAKILGKL